MKRTGFGFLIGLLVGAGAMFGYLRPRSLSVGARIPPRPSPICYSCLWQGYDAKLVADLVQFYRQFTSNDPIVTADARYVLWRATSTPNCDGREPYRTVASRDADPYRRFMAASMLAFGAPECGEDGTKYFRVASEAAANAGLESEAKVLSELAGGHAQPQFDTVNIERSLDVPSGATTMVLGASKLEITPGTKIGVQVDRVARDWISAQMKWTPGSSPIARAPIAYHEGAVVNAILDGVQAQVYPLAGSLVARRGSHWFAADDTGKFRFELLEDKMMYPTTHAAENFGFIEDTHGISVLVPQALERHAQVVIGCGDAEGKAYAAYYLAQRGVSVVFPGDRYQDMLLGYRGNGVLLGGSPVRSANGAVVLGDQPIRFRLSEPIVVEDTKAAFPIQYYDSGARYFRRLSENVKLNVQYVLVDNANQIDRVLRAARQKQANVVAVRVATAFEDDALREWLKQSPQHRAILFHSGLYPYAQPLFREFRAQVTFGDLRPRFE